MASLIFDKETKRRVSDLLIEVYCTEFKRDGCCLALDVFLVLAKKSMYSSKTTSLVRAKEFRKCCEVFEVVCEGVSPDVYLFTTVINAFCKRGRVEEGIELLAKMEEAGVVPNVVTYNTVIDGLGVIGRYDEVFMLKEKMVENGVEPTLVTYSVLVKDLIKAKRIGDAYGVVKKMTEKGFPPNVIVYNNLTNGLIEAGSLSKAIEVKEDMVSKGL